MDEVTNVSVPEAHARAAVKALSEILEASFQAYLYWHDDKLDPVENDRAARHWIGCIGTPEQYEAFHALREDLGIRLD